MSTNKTSAVEYRITWDTGTGPSVKTTTDVIDALKQYKFVCERGWLATAEYREISEWKEVPL